MPFIFTKYLLDDFDVPVVIEFSDDEKFFHKSKTTLEEQKTIWILNAKDFIACGFDMKKTFTFLSSQYVGYIYHNICKFQHAITYQQLRGIFGLNESDNCCKVSYPSVQAAPSLSSSFKHIQDKDEVMFLVTQGIDYFKNDYRFMLQTQGSQTWLHSFLISTMTLGDDLNVLLNNTKALQIQLKLYFQDLFQKRLKKIKNMFCLGIVRLQRNLKKKVLIFQQMSHIIIRDSFSKMIFVYKKSEINMERVS
ncbi:unnamed protein product [Paramecium pentaurelia]|uniref:Uncharacterized protein n=1 Tax=Paramecium pentaurelia TaxID=43138 RepID=A0A8S1SCA4_9CILI|nr:unnamed protein product [Paramecium pentaurelia]